MSFREPSTRGSLLLRLRDISDAESWSEFVSCYAPRIFAWCRRFGLQDSDAADATQTVLMKLLHIMRKFDYDPSAGKFRSWLQTVAIHVVRDVQRDWESRGRGIGDTQRVSRLSEIAAPDALESLAAEIEATHREELLRIASHQVRLRVKPQTWEAYYRTAVLGIVPAVVAADLKIPISEVYVAKSRILKMLREEVKSLDPGEE
jgi:RNA polymerase sigma-70 factor, ECF subfamily